jgi:hypothetical protein
LVPRLERFGSRAMGFEERQVRALLGAPGTIAEQAATALLSNWP